MLKTKQPLFNELLAKHPEWTEKEIVAAEQGFDTGVMFALDKVEKEGLPT
jgi:hypothetical protein